MPLDRTSEFLDLSETANLWAGILTSSENGLVVQVGALETVPVIRAASCLLELAEGDTVLLHGRYPRVYAIAVLSRAGGINCVLSPSEGTIHVSPCDKGTIAVIATNTEDYVDNVHTFTLSDNNGVLFAQVQAPVKDEIALRALFVKHYSEEIPMEVLRMMLGEFRLSNALVVLFRMTCPDWVGEGYDWHGPLPHEFSEEVTKARKFYKS